MRNYKNMKASLSVSSFRRMSFSSDGVECPFSSKSDDGLKFSSDIHFSHSSEAGHDMQSFPSNLSLSSLQTIAEEKSPAGHNMEDMYEVPTRHRPLAANMLSSTYPRSMRPTAANHMFSSLQSRPSLEGTKQNFSWTHPSLMGLALSSAELDTGSDHEDTFTEYKIRIVTTNSQECFVWKRFSHFYEFHTLLCSIYPVSSLPVFPKRNDNGKSDDLASSRRLDLTIYLTELLDTAKEDKRILKELARFLEVSRKKLINTPFSAEKVPRKESSILNLYDISNFISQKDQWVADYFSDDNKFRFHAMLKAYEGIQLRPGFTRGIENNLRVMDRFPDISVTLADAVEDDEMFYSVYSHGNLKSLDNALSCTKLTESEVALLMKRLLEIILALHSCGIAHLDIRPENLFTPVEASSSTSSMLSAFRISNFQCSFCVNDFVIYKNIHSPKAHYVAPELLCPDIKKLGLILKAVDMWSVGIIAFKLLTGEFPFNGESRKELLFNIRDTSIEFPELSNLSEEAQSFISHLLIKDPLRRMTAKHASIHPFLRVMSRRTRLRKSSSAIFNSVCIDDYSEGSTFVKTIKKAFFQLGLDGDDDQRARSFIENLKQLIHVNCLQWSLFRRYVAKAGGFSDAEATALAMTISSELQSSEGD